MVLVAVSLALTGHFIIMFLYRQFGQIKLGLWLRLECSLDSLSIDPAHVIYVAEGHNVGSERQSSVMTLRKPIVTWYVKTFQKRQLRVLNPARINVFYWFNWLNLIGS